MLMLSLLAGLPVMVLCLLLQAILVAKALRTTRATRVCFSTAHRLCCKSCC